MRPPVTKRPLSRGLYGPEVTLTWTREDGTEEPFTFQWRDEKTPDFRAKPGDPVVVLTDEGALRRGRRRWHPGQVGHVLHKSKKHDLGWVVSINGFEVLLFSDELDYPSEEEIASVA